MGIITQSHILLPLILDTILGMFSRVRHKILIITIEM